MASLPKFQGMKSQRRPHIGQKGRIRDQYLFCGNFVSSWASPYKNSVYVRSVKAKSTSDLVRRYSPCEFNRVLVKVAAHVLEIGVDESLLDVESHGNNILCILFGKLHSLFNSKLVLEKELLVIRQHDDQRNIEDVLEPLGKLKWNGMSNVHAIAARSAACVEEEWLPFFIVV